MVPVLALCLFVVPAFCDGSTAALVSDDAFVLARKLETEGLYGDAVTEYKRVYFFNRDRATRCAVLLAIGMCHARVEEWEPAESALARSVPLCANDDARDERSLVLAQVQIAAADYSAAEFGLLKLVNFSTTESVKRRARFFLGVASTYRYQWERAREYLDQVLSDEVDCDVREKIRAALSPERVGGLRSTTLARMLSVIVPGLGQTYAGRPLEGFVSLAINAGLGTWLVFLVAAGDWSDAFAVVNFLFIRFYLGNLSNAEKYTEELNERLNGEIARDVIAALLAAEPARPVSGAE
jgi:TM2 domain-containing membrane protein YozV